MSNFEASYEKILDFIKSHSEKDNFSFQIRKPKLTDIEVIALNFTAEYIGIDSECQLFRMLPEVLALKIERSVYNRRKRKLFSQIALLQSRISNLFTEFEDYYIIDSMPLEVVKLSRSSRSQVCKNDYQTAPDKGYCASQKMYFYGYKLHAVCSFNGIFKSFDISKASVHDIHYLKDIKDQLNDCVIIGDRGYISAEVQLNLFENQNIKLEIPMRSNQSNYKKQDYFFRKSRKRIETLFSQLCDQFMIRRNYAKTFEGFKTRILSKISALTVIQAINRFVLDRNINNIKAKIA
jgi:hypothetical protein